MFPLIVLEVKCLMKPTITEKKFDALFSPYSICKLSPALGRPTAFTPNYRPKAAETWLSYCCRGILI